MISTRKHNRTDDYPDMHAAQARDFERRLLSAGFHFPVELNIAAFRVGVCGGDFAYAEHSQMFAWICAAAGNDISLTLAELHELNRQAGDPFLIAFNPNELAELICEDVLPVDIGRWAQAVRTLAQRRRRAAELRKQAQDLIGEPFDTGRASSKRKAAVVNRRRGGRCVSAR